MSSKRSRAPSIAARLVFLFTLAATALLCCGLGVLYWIVTRHAYEEDNEVLADRVLALRADLEAEAGPRVLEPELQVQRSGERVGYFIRVLDSNGASMAETPGMNEFLPTRVFPPPTPSVDEPIRFRAGGHLFALMTTAGANARQPFTIQVAQDRSSDEQFTQRFRALLAAVIAGGALASGAIGLSVTRRGLRPLAEMTHSLERVGATRLHERVPPAGWPRELQPLVVAFDEMLDRLEDAFTRLSQFSADLAHELRTPIANLRGEAEVALRRERTSDDYREVIESSVAECERLSGVIDSLLFLARAEAAQNTVVRETFDGCAAVQKIVDYYHTLAEERGVAIECTGQGEVHADRTLFARAVSNLVDNALRHTPDGGRIEVGISAVDGRSEVVVRDNGVGIPPEHLPRVFDRLYRVDSARSTGGTGLGLALVQSIAALHGGSAHVSSEVGRGTAVTISFAAQ